ncbi:KAP family P-loop NTPase fold protein [Aeromonas hydrophila]|uniref:KAP family P-loop NTPase fold protein n=1 Tax=Aeromonas hydrophila TaxID=644 RepID=UPI001C5BD69B|nr:P-loop NTPase fold protein [Aeromonas hydrophila]MBW3845073.1 NTPase KAP [Aeromonas hydrophila]
MPDSCTNTDKRPNTTIPLRFSQLSIGGGDWPCAADKLGRSQEIENLTPVLLNAEAPLVFAIDAPWGGGKTTFIKLWQHYLTKKGKVSLYLNAWESDFADDPLLPMLAVLDDWLNEQSSRPVIKEAWDKAKACAPGIIKATAVAAAKAATFGALDLDKEYEKLAADLTGDAVGGLIDSFNVKQKALAKFKQQLLAALDALPDDQANLIVFVDELDRCKPTYAIDVLERIKHLFDIDRLVFVLAVNRNQLSKSIQGVYGPNFDGLNYLKRFIDLDYHLRIPDRDAYIRARLQQQDLQNYFAKRKDRRDEINTVESMLFWLCARFDYTLRDIDQLVTRWRLIVRAIPCNHYLDTVVLLSMLVLRQANNNLYQRFVQDPMCTNEVIEYLLGGDAKTTPFPRYFGFICGWLIKSGYDEDKKPNVEPMITYWEQLGSELPDDNSKQGELANLVQIARKNDMWRNYSDVRKTSFNRIELVNQMDLSD